jgi:hypothetical protein
MPLERATYQGILLTAQLPLVVVCDVTLSLDDVSEVADDEVSLVDAVAAVVVVLAVESSAAVSFSDLLALLVLDDAPDEVLVLAAAVCVVVALCPSRQAMAPPSDTIAAMLRAAAALRALAARGLRRGRSGRRVGVVGSSMPVNLRTSRERSTRGG